MAAKVWSEGARRALLAAGGRGGAARGQVVDLLAEHDCALTAGDICRKLPQVGRASVYRSLEQLEGLGLVQRLDLGGGAAGYERSGPGSAHHHHLVCRACGELVPFSDDGLEQAIHDVARESGFRVVSHEVTLQGTCPGCAAAAEGAGRDA